MDPMDVLAPNYLGDLLDNRGVDELVRNRGHGVAESMPPAMRDRDISTNPAAQKDKLRTAKAREFGMTKETVGF
jgi:hypothetical protein